MSGFKVGVALFVTSVALLTACSTDADVASSNLSQDADNFKIKRRIVFSTALQIPTCCRSRDFVQSRMRTNSLKLHVKQTQELTRNIFLAFLTMSPTL